MPQTVARHVTEIGRLRIGTRVPIKGGKHAGDPRPERLKHFRLTSNSKAALEVCARRYGGTVQAWTIPPAWKDKVPPPDHAWELFTTSETLDILFHPGGVMTTSWEEWQGGYCVLRCNGQYIVKDGTGKRVGDPCHCPDDPHARKALAMETPPKACEEISRIAVFLEGVPLGQWRLDTKGFYAPAEIRGLQDIMAACEVADMLVRARLRLEWRTDKKMEDGKPSTLIYPCVVIEPRQSADELLALGEAHRERQLHPALERKQLPEHIADLSEPLDPTAPVARAPQAAPQKPVVGPSLAATIAELSDPVNPTAPPAGEAGAEYLAQIEAVILGHGGQVEPWMRWAERRLQKDRRAFTVPDYQLLLTEARTLAAQRQATQPQDAPSPPIRPSADADEARAYTVDPETGTLLDQDGTPLPTLMAEEDEPGLFGGDN